MILSDVDSRNDLYSLYFTTISHPRSTIRHCVTLCVKAFIAMTYRHSIFFPLSHSQSAPACAHGRGDEASRKHQLYPKQMRCEPNAFPLVGKCELAAAWLEGSHSRISALWCDGILINCYICLIKQVRCETVGTSEQNVIDMVAVGPNLTASEEETASPSATLSHTRGNSAPTNRPSRRAHYCVIYGGYEC